MSSSDAIIWNIESDPHLRSTVMAVWELDRVPEPDRMATNIDRMVAAIPRLRQRVEDGRPRPSWVPTAVDLDRHYVVDDLPPGATFADALAYAERWACEPFDRDAPLWRLGLLTGLGDDRAAAVIKVHHSIADGLGMVLMLGAFTDLERHPAATPRGNVMDFPVERPTWSSARRAAHRMTCAARRFAATPVTASRDSARALGSMLRLVQPNRVPCSPLMTDRSPTRRLDARQLPLADVKAAGRAHGRSVNDVFVAVVTDAVRRYHWRSGARCEQLRIHVPVNTRTARTADVAGNEFVPARVVVELDGERGSIDGIGAQLERLRGEPALRHVNTVSAGVHRLGRRISRTVIGGMMRGVDVLASNVPGPPFPLYLAGTRIDRFVALGPPAGAAVNVTAFSYDGALQLGITTDAAAVPDRALFLECLDRTIDELIGPSTRALAV